MGFGKGEKNQKFSIKVFQLLREKMKEAEFHRESAKGETDEENGEEGIQEELPMRHRSLLESRRHPMKLASIATEPL